MTVDTRPAAQELMDDPACGERQLRRALRDLEWMNRHLGAHAFVRRYLDRVLPVWRARRPDPAAPLLVLDVATGGADVPLVVAGWAAQRRVPARIVAIDRHPTTARLAREATAPHAGISILVADACALPFADASFDVALCTLALHHLSEDAGADVLRRLHRLTRIGFLAVDLARSRAGYAAVWLATRLSRSPLIRHDGPLSVRRARSVGEYRHLAAVSGVPGLRVSTLPLFRVALATLA